MVYNNIYQYVINGAIYMIKYVQICFLFNMSISNLYYIIP